MYVTMFLFRSHMCMLQPAAGAAAVSKQMAELGSSASLVPCSLEELRQLLLTAELSVSAPASCACAPAASAQVLLLLLSFAGFAVVLRAIMDIFSGAMAEAAADGTSRLLMGRMLALTLVVWSLFPLVWLLGQAGVVSLTVEQVWAAGCSLGMGKITEACAVRCVESDVQGLQHAWASAVSALIH
jgi:hypothetical protein